MTCPLPRIDPEFKSLIPPLSPEEYLQLEQNIFSQRKCHSALTTWEGILVDGHNRLNICAAHGITFEIEPMEFTSRDEAKLWILDNQLGRRNLTDAMRIELAVIKTQLIRQQAKENQIRAGGDKTRAGALCPELPKTQYEPINIGHIVAEEAGVSRGNVYNYLQISKQAPPELQARVKSGELKIGTAHRLLPSEIQKQLKHADKLYRYIKSRIPLIENDTANQEIKAKLAAIYEQLEILRRSANEQPPAHRPGV